MTGQIKKRIPERRCTGCGERRPKSELIRVVRSPDGEINLDFKGKMSGRGAYICKSASCLLKARKSGRIARGLEVEIPDAIYDRLEKEISGDE